MVASLIVLISANMQKQTNSSKLIYIGDPMCSWCYGFAPELQQVVNELPEDVSFEVVAGGLRPNGTETMAELKEFLTHHWEQVHDRSGQEFNYSVLDSSDWLYDTEPSCRAVVTMRKLNPDKEFEYFKLIQKGFYVDNHHPSRAETFARQAASLGVDEAAFIRLFNSDEMKNGTRADFNKARRMGVNSFPSLVLEHQGKQYLLAQGYARANSVSKRIQKIIE